MQSTSLRVSSWLAILKHKPTRFNVHKNPIEKKDNFEIITYNNANIFIPY